MYRWSINRLSVLIAYSALQAGLVAYLVGLEGNKPTSEVLARLKEFSPDGILTGVREFQALSFPLP